MENDIPPGATGAPEAATQRLPAQTKPGVVREPTIDQALRQQADGMGMDVKPIAIGGLNFTKDIRNALRTLYDLPEQATGGGEKKQIIDHALMIVGKILAIAEETVKKNLESNQMTYEQRRRTGLPNRAASLSNKMRDAATWYLRHNNAQQRDDKRIRVVRQLVVQFIDQLAKGQVKCSWIKEPDQQAYIRSVQTTHHEIVRQAGIALHFPMLHPAKIDEDKSGVDYWLGEHEVQVKAKYKCDAAVLYQICDSEQARQRFFCSPGTQRTFGKVESFFRSYHDGILLIIPAQPFDPITLAIDETTKENIRAMLRPFLNSTPLKTTGD